MVVSHKKINPNGHHLLKYIKDPAIRMIILYGGSSSGKTYSAAQILLLMTLWDGENTLVLRKVAASIERSVYEDFKVAANQLKISHNFKFQDGRKRIKCRINKAKIDFYGLDNPEKIKGISNYMRLLLEELSEFDYADFKQLRLRLRGKAGQKIVATFNPIKETHWIKRDVIDRELWHSVPMSLDGMPDEYTAIKTIKMNAPKAILNPRTQEIEEHAPDMVLLQSTYLNNFWVVGSPDGTYGYYDEQCVAEFEYNRLHDPDFYNVYALGEWGVIRTGSEFFGSFNQGAHCAKVGYDPTLPLHISIDQNRLPYITVTYWQLVYGDDRKELRQVGETCAGNPDNTATKSAKLTAKCLREMGYTDKLYLHGDASTRNGSTIDDEGRSFLDLFIATLQREGFEVVDKVGTSNPSVSMTGEFINAIWEGQLEHLGITIGDHCTTSIEDYLSVQKNENGGMLKTKVKDKVTMQTYEEHGHISDTFRYVCHDLMRDEYIKFANRRKRNLYAKDGHIHFFNSETECAYTSELVYCMPNVNGKYVMVHGKLCGEQWHIVDAALFATSSIDDIKRRLNRIGCSPTYIETGAAYYPMVREIRKEQGYTVKVMPETGDIDRRIAATSDYVRSSILFHPVKATDDEEYAAFMTSLLDYNADSKDKEASAVLSGFIKVALKISTLE